MTGSRRSLSLALFLLLSFTPLLLLADGSQLGTISGKVVDQTGAVLPGATIEVTNLEKGSTRTAVSDAQGRYNIALLQPGPYRVAISLEGFDRFLAKNAIVSVDKVTTVDATLGLSKAAETITIQGDVPIVDKTDASQRTTLESALTQKLPTPRNYQNLALATPGAVLPGNANANPNFHGGLLSDNLFLFDGIDTTDPTTGGFGQNFTFEAIQEVQITTSAASADYGRAVGGIINVVTKSGTNDFKGSLKDILTNDNWNEQNKGANPVSGATFARTKLDKTIPVYSATLGGPIWRDHAWFFGAYETDKTTSAQRQTVDPAHPQNFVSQPEDKFYDLKGSWQVTAANLLIVKANAAPTNNIAVDRHNGGINAIPRFAADLGAMNVQDQTSRSRALQYSGVPASNIALEGGLATSLIHIGFRPFVADTPVHQDLRNSLFYNGPSIVGFLERARQQANFSGSYYHVIGGQTHNFKAGFDYQKLRSSVDQRFGGNQLFLDKSYDITTGTFVPFQRRDYDTPAESTSHGKNTALYALDKFQVGAHLNLNVGVRAEKQTGKSDLGTNVVDTSTISPRLSATYDLRGDGKTLVLGSYGRFYQDILQSFDDAFAGVPQKTNYSLFNWDAATGQFVPGGHVQFGGNSTQVNDIKPPYIDELTLGFQQQIGRTIGVGLRGIHRSWGNLIDDVFEYPAGSASPIRTFTNLAGAKRTYNALETTFDKRFTERWSANASYVWSRTSGNQFATINSNLGDYANENCRSGNDPTIGTNGTINCGVAVATNRSGAAPFDRTNVFHALTAYKVPVSHFNLTIAPALLVESGDTYQKQGTLSVLGPDGKTNGSTVTYFYSGQGSSRLPTIYQLDLASEATLPVAGFEFGLKGEIFNITNTQKQIQASSVGWCNAATAACTTLQQSYGIGTSRNAFQNPRNYRITALVRF
jgi:Carboxypeptidase regulatory-like domain/TonB-dependent Receptor Plug Domain